MKRWPPQSPAAAAVLAVVALVAVLTSRPPQMVLDTYASTDFHSGGYRAWALLLGREGVKTARFVQRPIELDRRTDTLISAQPVPALTPDAARTEADVAALAAWVRAGGRLVYLGRNVALGSAQTKLLELPAVMPSVGPRGGLTGPDAAPVGPLEHLGQPRMLFVEHAGRVELADGNGDIVVRYPLGRGEVVAVVSPAAFTNANIVSAGNARLAYLLGLPGQPGGVVAFDDGLHGGLIDRPWYQALPVPVKVSLGFLGLAALLALIGSALGSGPPLPPRPKREPTSAEFVAALAALHERIAAREPTAAILADAALSAVARAGGQPDGIAPALLPAGLTGRSGAAEVAQLIAERNAPVSTDAALLASAKLAHTVRKDWIHGGYRDRRRTAFAGRTRARRGR